MSPWFLVKQISPHLIVFRERLDLVEPRFLTTFTNIYLLLGEHTAMLIDTGTGLGDLSSVVASFKGDRDLIVVNTHNHFDHVGSNAQFDTTHIHRMDFKKLMSPMEVFYLENAQEPYVTHFRERHWKINFADEMIPLVGNEIIDLGGLKVEVMHTPGHTPGSICLLTDSNEVFTGDTIHYGTVYLPDEDKLDFYLQSLEVLKQRVELMDAPKIFPGHEDFKVGPKLFDKFMNQYVNIDWSLANIDLYLNAEVVTSADFIFVRPYTKF